MVPTADVLGAVDVVSPVPAVVRLCADCQSALPESYEDYRQRCLDCWKQWARDNYDPCEKCHKYRIKKGSESWKTVCRSCFLDERKKTHTKCPGCVGTPRENWHSVKIGQKLCWACYKKKNTKRSKKNAKKEPSA